MLELYIQKANDFTMRECGPAPAPKDNEVKLKIIYGGICGSDLRVLNGSLPHAVIPCRPGHEILGVVLEAGKNAPYKVGTKVASFPNTYCGKCEFCLQGRTNICKTKKSYGVTIDGLFAEEVTIDSEFLVPVPDDLPNERAILIEPFAVNVHALKRAKIGKGTSVAVIGCGTEGLLSIALLSYMGAAITVLDINPVKMEKAKEFGENIKALNPKDVKDETFDVVVEAAGVKNAVEQAFQIVKPGGVIVELGMAAEDINYPAIRVVRGEITIYGTIIYTKNDFEDAITFLKDPAFNVKPVLSQIVPFSQYKEAFQNAKSGNYAKIVLDFQVK